MTKHFANEGRVVLLVVVSAFGTIQVTPRMMQCPCEPHPICLCHGPGPIIKCYPSCLLGRPGLPL